MVVLRASVKLVEACEAVCCVGQEAASAPQPLRVWPGTALSSLFRGLSKAHQHKEAVAAGGPRGGGRGMRRESQTATLLIMSGDNYILVSLLL